MPSLRDAYLDLVLGGCCVGCALPGRALCVSCAADLPVTASPCTPRPCPPGLAPAYACGPYDGVLRALVVEHKERGLRAVRADLSLLLARAVVAAVAAAGVEDGDGLLLVPVPSRRSSVRARGDDPTYAMTRGAARLLHGAGRPARETGLLRLRPGVVDQAGLDREARRRNLDRSMAVRTSALRRLAASERRAHVVICDDVLTTASTVREAQRALEAVGVRVLAVACVAATPRRTGPGRLGSGRIHDETSGGSLPPPRGLH